MELILASTSPYRRSLLERLGLPFRAEAPPYREVGPETCPDPRRMAAQNALGKALSLLDRCPDSLVVGSDQVVCCGEEVFAKPGTAERAVEQLLRLAGREHELLTAVSVVRSASRGAAPGDELPGETALAVNQVRLRPLTRAEAEAYVARERPLDCAGAYKSEALGITLIEYLRGDDPTAVVGLPLIALSRLLRRFGLDPLAAGASGVEDAAGPVAPGAVSRSDPDGRPGEPRR